MSANGFTEIVYFRAGQIANFSQVQEASVKMSKWGLEMVKTALAAQRRPPGAAMANLRIASTGKTQACWVV